MAGPVTATPTSGSSVVTSSGKGGTAAAGLGSRSEILSAGLRWVFWVITLLLLMDLSRQRGALG
jgi:hypothetical protein